MTMARLGILIGMIAVKEQEQGQEWVLALAVVVVLRWMAMRGRS